MIKYSPIGVVFATLIALQAVGAESRDLVREVEVALPPHVGACVLAIDRGKLVFEHAYGVTDVGKKEACTPSTNFRIGSVSKQFTATAIMLLVDRKQLALDDPITKFFPGFPAYGKDITVKHLLTHTSGLPGYENLIPPGTKLQLTDLDVLHLLMDTKEPRFKPGSKFEYSNSGYGLLGLIVQVAAKQPFQEFVASEIFRPLGMSESLFYVRGLNEIHNRAFGHERKDNDWEPADQSLTSAVLGDGGVYTSLKDYEKWLRGLDDHKLLSNKSYDAMFSPQVLTDRNGAHYGYGWFLDEYRGEPRIQHGGETRGFRAFVQRFPKRGAAMFLQLNGGVDPSVKPMKVAEQLADTLIFNRSQDDASRR